ncbi:RNA polymerase sigma factor [Euzebya tangerina]|uniref:RNA polymerase sigma factor n=1 Tax=Euzebya tangerina TaxID=591198 RepID=UPI000E310C8A|nr:sigma-70 family RNA polymerase sigma factor [Euzebya tangerina]
MSRRSDDDEIQLAAARAAAGDSRAFDDVCRAHADDVWRYCNAILRDRERAFDATQDTFLRATSSIRRFRGDAPVRVWLLIIARRAVIDMLRRDDRRNDRQALAPAPDAVTGADTEAVLIEQLVAELPEDRRQAFVLTQLVGLSYEEAAGVADVPVGTIRSRVSRARRDLVTALAATDEAEPRRDQDPVAPTATLRRPEVSHG